MYTNKVKISAFIVSFLLVFLFANAFLGNASPCPDGYYASGNLCKERCKEGYQELHNICYEKATLSRDACREGYKDDGLWCSRPCPAGEEDLGIKCRRTCLEGREMFGVCWNGRRSHLMRTSEKKDYYAPKATSNTIIMPRRTFKK